MTPALCSVVQHAQFGDEIPPELAPFSVAVALAAVQAALGDFSMQLHPTGGVSLNVDVPALPLEKLRGFEEDCFSSDTLYRIAIALRLQDVNPTTLEGLPVVFPTLLDLIDAATVGNLE